MLPYQAKQRLQEIATRMKEIKGMKMEDFDFDNLLDEIDEEVKVEEAEQVDVDLDSLLDATPEPVVQAEVEPVVEEVVEVVKPQPKVNVTVTDIEYAQETDAYVRAKLQLEAEVKALKQEQKNLQEEFKEQGVDIKSANKAVTEMKKELKESPGEAKLVEGLKNRYRNDESIFATIGALID